MPEEIGAEFIRLLLSLLSFYHISHVFLVIQPVLELLLTRGPEEHISDSHGLVATRLASVYPTRRQRDACA
ncbi:hypothetical protein [Streptomyces sannanensis]|uniref:hypothetical protein n=1 Tax=Streptomyces sannanensis TaxID=285536 RepID=UPI0031ED5A9C